jgi:hypothetical protein
MVSYGTLLPNILSIRISGRNRFRRAHMVGKAIPRPGADGAD